MENIDFNKLIGEEENKAYEDYVKLTEYNNLIYTDYVLLANIDYASRDMTFPVGLVIKD